MSTVVTSSSLIFSNVFAFDELHMNWQFYESDAFDTPSTPNIITNGLHKLHQGVKYDL